MPEKKHIYTVSELTRQIKVVLERGFSAIWVEGEISNFTKHSSGHMYFSLKDEGSVLSAVLFRGVNRDLKFELESGIKVICFGRISLYEKRGQYQLYVDKIEPKGVGALQLTFEQLKGRLAKEGLFDPKHKRPIPFLPQRIGVVTSPTGAAIRDILKVLKRRFANLEIILNPVRVQGEGAASEIAQAIDEFNRYGKVDVLIVGRGGGSLEDLWAFNEEVLARAIYRSQIPVISAVGHEIDSTIADFVADLRVATPSAAAEQVIAHKQELIDRIDNFYSRAKIAILSKIELLQNKLDGLKERYAFRQPIDLIQQYQQRIDDLVLNLDRKVKHLTEIYQQRYNGLIGKLHALSPLNILSRGYSITLLLPKAEVVTKAQVLEVGAKVETRVAKGAFVSKVEKILKEE
ncbi:MAG: exodeoxyribonuclease VII large subunit [Candidatus Omnitrophica bacterium]|nr:exodeoxyribonuclease VII large subunit [Candidatus Omnitrophota bacterium]